jgi:hypothetical protein
VKISVKRTKLDGIKKTATSTLNVEVND